MRQGGAIALLDEGRPAMASSMDRCDARGSWKPVIKPSTTCTPRSGVITVSVQPRAARTRPVGSTADSSARTTVVPTATTRPPPARTALTWRAVDSGTSKRSAYGGSSASGDATPVCSVIGRTTTPPRRQRAHQSAVNGRPALGISALPGSRAKTVWYASRGQA